MFYCEECRVKNDWPTGLPGSRRGQLRLHKKRAGAPWLRVLPSARCEVCGLSAMLCYDVPAKFLPLLGAKDCEVKGCKAPAIPDRIICDGHAYPAELRRTGRRQAIEAQKKAKDSRLADENRKA